VQGSVDVVLLLKKLCDDLRGNICPKLGWFRRCIRQRHILVVCKCMHLLNMDILLNIVINTLVCLNITSLTYFIWWTLKN